ncbi:hypothetical protein [Bacillus pseudomycoides]|uniref:hypothetical protein n=1 Tax=Bacillus pseudomycoides TaxID=64104 RepID=UPI0023DAA93F|nr:hypothetical protein [Bacillus pseudomycoides]MDF2082760.1 hypothetical protein [Bacillus pseudomycoides]
MSKKNKKQNKKNTKELVGEKEKDNEGNVQKTNTISKMDQVVQVMKFVKVVIEFINLLL